MPDKKTGSSRSVDGARYGWPCRYERIDLAGKKFVQKRRALRRVAPATALAPTLAEGKGLFKTADRSRGKTPRGGRWSAERPLDPRAAIKVRERLAS
jgi:hypothetical protein